MKQLWGAETLDIQISFCLLLKLQHFVQWDNVAVAHSEVRLCCSCSLQFTLME